MNIERALVTGGASGLGAVIVRTLAGRGARVLIADRDHASAADLAVELKSSGAQVSVAEVDMSEEPAVRALFELVGEGGPLDLLVNNAGGWLPGPQFPIGDSWLRSLDLNLRMPMLATQLALPLLRRGGAVVNVSSSGGWDSGAYGSPEYGAAKAGLIRFTTAVGDFADRYGVRVSCVVPHWIGLPRAIAAYEELTLDEQADSGGLVDPQVVATTVVELALDPGSGGSVVVIRAGRPAYRIDPAANDPYRRTAPPEPS